MKWRLSWPLSEADIDDLAAETFKKHAAVFNTGARKLPPDSSAETVRLVALKHINEIAHNLAVSHLRRQRRQTDPPAPDELGAETADADIPLDDGLVSQQRGAIAMDFLRRATDGWPRTTYLYIEWHGIPAHANVRQSKADFIPYARAHGVTVDEATIYRHIKYGQERLEQWIYHGVPLSYGDDGG